MSSYRASLIGSGIQSVQSRPTTRLTANIETTKPSKRDHVDCVHAMSQSQVGIYFADRTMLDDILVAFSALSVRGPSL